MKIVNIELSKLRNSDISEEDAKRESKKNLAEITERIYGMQKKIGGIKFYDKIKWNRSSEL